MEPVLYFTKIYDSPYAKIPCKMSSGSAGYDIYTNSSGVISPGKQKLVSTGIAMVIPNHCYGRIAPRSGLGVRGIHVGAGVIDSDYRGEVKVLLLNFGEEPFYYNSGDRVAQLILEKIETNESSTEISSEEFKERFLNTERGTGGFGSTGTS
jgi:dUTP pyrophosphatase